MAQAAYLRQIIVLGCDRNWPADGPAAFSGVAKYAPEKYAPEIDAALLRKRDDHVVLADRAIMISACNSAAAPKRAAPTHAPAVRRCWARNDNLKPHTRRIDRRCFHSAGRAVSIRAAGAKRSERFLHPLICSKCMISP